MALLNSFIPAIACALSIFIPESPVFLAKNGKDEAAKKSLRRLMSNVDRLGQVLWLINYMLDEILICFRRDVDEELGIIKSSLEETKNKPQTGFLCRHLVQRPEVYKPFGIFLFLILVQQFSATSILRTYVVEIFNNIFMKDGTVDSIVPKNVTCTFDGEDFGSTSSNAYIAAIITGTTKLMGYNFVELTERALCSS